MASKYSSEIKEYSPLALVSTFSVFEKLKEYSLQFSVYTNGVPGFGKTEKRSIHSTSDVHRFYQDINTIIGHLAIKEELTLHSLILWKGRRYHIPFIDFYTSSSEEVYNSLEVLREKYNFDIYIFETGRSFHAYFDGLLPQDEWIKFLADLLLLNKYDRLITDFRWVAHSMNQGFSSLRQSCNTPVYLEYPKYHSKISKFKMLPKQGRHKQSDCLKF